jgi:GR25 family glycosyltransferase involved in LPS biosynthesis
MSEPCQIVNPEYLRRNLMVCRAIGANANAKAAITRLKAQKRPAQWLLAYLQGIIERTEHLPGELACYRSGVPINVPRSSLPPPDSVQPK